MTAIDPLLIDFNLLDKEYPGIIRIQSRLKSAYHNKLIILSNLIKYNVPKQYYSQDIQQFSHFLQQTCFDILNSSPDLDEDFILPAEINRTLSPISDEEEAQVIKQIHQQTILQPSKFNIIEFQRYLQNFQIQQSRKFVNPQIIHTLSQLQKCKTQKSVFENFQQKQKIQKKTTFNKTASFKSRDTPVKKSRQQKQQITITMGDKIPLQVKQMRNYVKAASLQSFAVSSIQNQQQKSNEQKNKLHISLSLNKVAKQNMSDIYGQIQPFVIQSYVLSQFLVNQIFNKCILQFKMIPIYIQFYCMFANIPQKQFCWSYNQMKNKNYKMNSIHCLFTQKIEYQFKQSIKNIQKSKQLKSIGNVIGLLIRKRKISKKIYLESNNFIISAILQNCGKPFLQQYQNYFECELCLIQSLGNRFDQIWKQYSLEETLLTQVKFKINQILPNQTFLSLKQLLNTLNQKSAFPTARVKCLIQNIFERRLISKQNQTTLQQNISNQKGENYDKIHQILKEQNGIKLALQFYFQNNCRSQILYHIILQLFDGTQSQIKRNIEQVKMSEKVNKQQFYFCIEQNIVDLMFQQCDLPFMAQGISLLLIHYSQQSAKTWAVQADQDDDDYNDTKAFIEKISKKITYYINSNDKQLCH